MSEQGRKYDGGKLRYDLVPTLALEEVVKVITKGAEKYDDDNWKNVPEGRRRYYAASLRHIQEWKKGNPYDEEMGTHHIANAISNLMFILEKELQGWEDVPEVVEDISEQECVDYHQKLLKEWTIQQQSQIKQEKPEQCDTCKDGLLPWPYSASKDGSPCHMCKAGEALAEANRKPWYPPVEDGGNPWIEWDKGEIPANLTGNELVDILMREEREDKQFDSDPWIASKLCWDNDGCSWDIVAYRVV